MLYSTMIGLGVKYSKPSMPRGFTIVELLIVIVVIAILAAISVVAYNGIQTRAENAKTVSAISTWAKALSLYRTDKGYYPVNQSCLGDTNTYSDSNNSRCWSSNNSMWVVSTAFLSEISAYMSTYPEPSIKNINTGSTSNAYRGGIYYQPSVGDERIYVGILGGGACPSISGLGASFQDVAWPGGKECRYRLPQ